MPAAQRLGIDKIHFWICSRDISWNQTWISASLCYLSYLGFLFDTFRPILFHRLSIGFKSGQLPGHGQGSDVMVLQPFSTSVGGVGRDLMLWGPPNCVLMVFLSPVYLMLSGALAKLLTTFLQLSHSSEAHAHAEEAIPFRCIKLFFFLFTLGTELGNELFYISFFPFWIWNVDAHVGRRVIVIWVWVMYLGQCTKDLIRWPRPPSPPVLKLEVFYNSEYGMPSTHAMSGTAIPLALLLLTWGRWQYPLLLGLVLAVCWCSLVCLSRVYMGMHSILDVVAGVLYAVLIMIVFHPALDIVDNFNLTYKYAPLIIISLHVALGVFSFTLDTWSTSRGDTAEILGSGAGIACGSHVRYMLGILKEPSTDSLPFTIPPVTVTLVGKAMLRVLIGLVVLLLIRAVMKMITIPMACKVFGIPCDDVRKARQRMEVELPYRYLTYVTVGFAVMFLIPYLFTWVGLH